VAKRCDRDNAGVSDLDTIEPQQQPPQRQMPRRGRGWVILIGVLVLFALGYSLVNIATQKPNKNIIHIEGVGETQELFGGVPQEGARLGSEDAPVTVQVFADEQSSDCREGFLSTMPELAEKYARTGKAKFLYRHYSNSENEIELGFYATEAAAEQGYGWEYAYLFFVNQKEADRFGVSEAENHRAGLRENFLESVAGGVEELEDEEWEDAFEEGREANSAVQKSLQAQEELGSKLGIRYGIAMIIEGPRGSETLQENPSLAEVEAAITRVE
jgi:protein-disulfide isomerase